MTVTMITVGGDGTFTFCAAHSGLHGGQFEPMHGHSYAVTLRLHGGLDQARMVCDFSVVKEALTAVIAPLRRRTLMPAQPLGGRCARQGGQVIIECGGKRYSLPAQDVVLLPVANTPTEALAAYLLAELMLRLDAPALELAELILAEAPGRSATAAVRPGGR